MTGDQLIRSRLGGLFVLDPGQRIVQWSEGAAALIGVPDQAALGRSCFEVVKGRDAFSRRFCGPQCPPVRALKQGKWSGRSLLFIKDGPGPPLRLQCNLTALPPVPGGALGCFYTTPPKGAIVAKPEYERTLSSLNQIPELVQDLSILTTLITSVSEGSPQENMETTLNLLRDITGAEAAEIFLSDPRRRGMILTCHSGLWQKAFFQITRFKPGEGFPGLVLSRHEPIVTRNLTQDSRYLRESVKEKGFNSYVCIPLHPHLGSGKIVGSLNLAFRRPEADLNRAFYLLSWVRGLLNLMIEANFLRVQGVGGRMGLDAHGDLEGDFHYLLSLILKQLMETGGAQGAVVNLIDPAKKGISRRVIAGSVTGGPCQALESANPQKCPALAYGCGLALYGSRKSWPQSCQHASRIGEAAYCIPLLGGEINGVVQVVYQGFVPSPPTRNLVILEGMVENVMNTVRDAWKYMEGLDRAARATGRLYQARPGLDERRISESPLAAVRAKKRKEQEPLSFLDIKCFGSFELYRRGALVTPSMIKRKKALELLKILITHLGHPLSKDALIEYLWPEAEPEAGENRLYVVIHALRKLIEPQDDKKWVFLLNEGSCYYFNVDSTSIIDANEFKIMAELGRAEEGRGGKDSAIHAYESAVMLYRGDFLEEDLYAEWCSMEREHYRETCLNILKSLAALWKDAGGHEHSIKHLRRALRIDPLREEIHRELMHSLWIARRRDEALRQYKICRKMLMRELDVEPLPETDMLMQRIRNSTQPRQEIG